MRWNKCWGTPIEDVLRQESAVVIWDAKQRWEVFCTSKGWHMGGEVMLTPCTLLAASSRGRLTACLCSTMRSLHHHHHHGATLHSTTIISSLGHGNSSDGWLPPAAVLCCRLNLGGEGQRGSDGGDKPSWSNRTAVHPNLCSPHEAWWLGCGL